MHTTFSSTGAACIFLFTACLAHPGQDETSTSSSSSIVEPTTTDNSSNNSSETTVNSTSSTSTTYTSHAESTKTEDSTITADTTTTTTDPPCTENCCGNHTIEAPETCDDANDKIDDGCHECQLIPCGNGHVDVDLGETCDSGKDALGKVVDCGTNGLACTYCGDGSRNGLEQCDMGSENRYLDVLPPENVYTLPQSPCNPTCTRNFRYVFITAKRNNGKLDGISGADVFCQTQANLNTSKVAGRVFRAWLSSADDLSTQDFDEELSPKTNMWTESDIPYILTDSKSIVASNFTNINTQILHPINMTESGTPPTQDCGNGNNDPCPVWTATKSDGTRDDGDDSADCTRWTSNEYDNFGSVGFYQDLQKWTSSAASNSRCQWERHLYCFEQ